MPKKGWIRMEEHHFYKGDEAIGRDTGHKRAQKIFPDLPSCEFCQSERFIQRHHEDKNTLNNAPGNVWFLCRSDHLRSDHYCNKIIKKKKAKQDMLHRIEETLKKHKIYQEKLIKNKGLDREMASERAFSILILQKKHKDIVKKLLQISK